LQNTNSVVSELKDSIHELQIQNAESDEKRKILKKDIEEKKEALYVVAREKEQLNSRLEYTNDMLQKSECFIYLF